MRVPLFIHVQQALAFLGSDYLITMITVLRRYQSLEGNLKDWKDGAPLEDNLKFFGWAPGLSYRPEREGQIAAVLSSHPRRNEVLAAIKEAHHWLHSGGCLLRGESPQNISDHSGWLSAYSLQPDVPFPERK